MKIELTLSIASRSRRFLRALQTPDNSIYILNSSIWLVHSPHNIASTRRRTEERSWRAGDEERHNTVFRRRNVGKWKHLHPQHDKLRQFAFDLLFCCDSIVGSFDTGARQTLKSMNLF